MLRGQGLKVAVICFSALLFGFAAHEYGPKVNHNGILIASICALFQMMLTVWACLIVARVKNLSSNWCFIGIIGLIGVGILLCIPAKKGEDMPEETKKDSEKPPSPIT